MRNQRSLTLWAVILLLIVSGLLTGGMLIRRSVAASFDMAEQIRGARTLLFDVLKDQLDEETGVRGFAATRDPLFLQPYEAARKQLPQTFAQLRMALDGLGMSSSSAALSAAQRTNDVWLRHVASPLLARPGRDALILQKRGKRYVDEFRADADRIQQGLQQRNEQLGADFQSDLARIGLLVSVAAILLIASGLLFSSMITSAWNRLDRERAQSEEAQARARSLRISYETEKRIADTLQDAVSQRHMPTVPAMTFSATYVPATEESRVGGDWYDAFEIGSGRILFAIGDVAGHGIQAAVTMSRVRNSVLSSALLEPDAASILARVNRQVLQSDEAPMVTAVVGIADSERFEFAYSTAGHPPPVLLEPGRPPRLLSFEGMPLGITENASYRTYRVQSVPGAMLVLYTDGVIEHSRNVVEGEKILLDAVAASRASDDEEPATTIYKAIFANRAVSDDVAILTIGFAGSDRKKFIVSAEDGKSAFSGQVDASSAAQPFAAGGARKVSDSSLIERRVS